MSYHVPPEQNYWQSSRSRHPPPSDTISSKLNGIFGSESHDLPMYKDKPHFQTRRRTPWYRKKRILIASALALLTFIWWFGIVLGSSRAENAAAAHPRKGWLERLLSRPDVQHKAIDWKARQDSVRDAFTISWDAYEKDGWGLDEWHPKSKNGKNMVKGGMGWIIVDALDTAIMMNLTSRVRHAREWISTSLHYDADHAVNTFETTIRMLGGLLSAHYLSTNFPTLAPLSEDDVNQPGEDLYIEKATDLADRILGAFESESGIPYASVNLNTSRGLPSHDDDGASSTAEAATLQLEYKYLAKLTGEAHYWEAVEKVIEVIDNNKMADGLLPIYLYPNSGHFRGENIRLGSRGDSYYEYLIKQYLQTFANEPVYLEMWDEALTGVKKHLITYSTDTHFSIIAERPLGLHSPLTPKMDHLVCFMPGTIALAVTSGQTVSTAKTSLGSSWTSTMDEDLALARELMKTCWGTYKFMATGLAPEIAYFHVDDPPLSYDPDRRSKAVDWYEEDGDWRTDFNIHSNDVHNLQRPETIESLFYMWRITQEPMYREWGWEMFQSFVTHTAVNGSDGKIAGFTSLGNANVVPAVQRDNMESFWLAETLKYFFLLFEEPDTITGEYLFSLEKNVINTEGHFFPRFEMGKSFKTGWKRKTTKEIMEEEGKKNLPKDEPPPP